MKSLEWMPLFGDDFWESERVASMDDSAALLYSWLLWRQFKHGDLPPADSLRRLPHRWPGKEFDRLWPQVKACFDVLDDGRLSNPRCADERTKMLARVEAARIKGSSGGRARAASRSSPGIAPATAQAEPRHNHSSSTGQAQTGPDRDQDRTAPSELPPTPRRGDPADKPPAGKRPRKEPAGPAADCRRHWDAEWSRTRLGTAWSWNARDASAVAKILSANHDATPEEVCRRMTRLLEDSDVWIAKNARPALLEDRWSQYAVEIRKNGKSNAAEQMLERALGGSSAA